MQNPPTLAPTRRAPLVSGPRLRSVSGIRRRIESVVADRYRLLECLGEGGMGTVWRARDCLLGTEVALKLHSGSNEMGSVDVFIREANAAARVRHPSSIRVLEIGVTADGTPYLVMDLARGETLAEHIRKYGRMAAERAVGIMLPLASALREAHRCGVVHRDIKPSNIMLFECDGIVRPQLLDFGIASIDDRHFEDGRDECTSVVWGTPPYMSPEQARGEPFDRRSDVWSFTAVLWETMTGRRLFPGLDPCRVLRRIADSDQRKLERPDEIEPSLWFIVERGLRAEACDRWSSFEELGQALAAWLYGRGQHADASGTCLDAHWDVSSEASLFGFSSSLWRIRKLVRSMFS
jgi:eukaryotic-like serine/threonine-protein kinase